MPHTERELFERLPAPAWVCDAESLRLLDANAAFCAGLQTDRAALLALSLADLQPAADLQALVDWLSAGASAKPQPVQLRAASGPPLALLLQAAAVDHGGRPAWLMLGTEVAATLDVPPTAAGPADTSAAAPDSSTRAGRESEDRLRFALEATGIGDWNMDLRSNQTTRSLLHDRCFGYTEPVAEWGYETFLAHVHPLDRARVDSSYQAAMAAGTVYDVEFRVVWPDGSLHWLWSRGQFFRDEHGTLYRATGIQVDITARGEVDQRREAELLAALGKQATAHAAHERLLDVLERVDDGFVALDLDGRYTYVNTRAARMLGRDRPEDLIGRHIWTEFPEGIGQAFHQACEEALQTQRPVVAEQYVEPTQRWIENRIYPSPQGLSVYFTETTERKLAERRVRAQLARTELLNRITRAIGDRLDLDAVFRVVADTVQMQLPAAFVAVALYEAGSESVSLRCIAAASAAHAQAAGLAEGGTVAIQRNGLSRCVAGELVHEPELDGLDFALPRHLLAAGLHSAVLAPLQVESTVFGLVIVARAQAGAFSSGECEFLRQLGEQVALAASQARLHQTLQHTFAELQRSQQTALQQERLRALGQMASGIAHDINNAIAPVALYTESLLDGEPGLSDRARQYLQVIQRSIDDVSETVARMREFYRPQPPDARHGTLALNTLVQQVVDLTRARWRDMAQQSGTVVQVRTVLADDLPLLQAADGEIREALTNLVLNAVDALPQGGCITLRTRQDGVGSGAPPGGGGGRRRCGHGRRHPPTLPGAVFHHQGRARHRPGPGHGLWLHAAPRRPDRDRQCTGAGQHGAPAAAPAHAAGHVGRATRAAGDRPRLAAAGGRRRPPGAGLAGRDPGGRRPPGHTGPGWGRRHRCLPCRAAAWRALRCRHHRPGHAPCRRPPGGPGRQDSPPRHPRADAHRLGPPHAARRRAASPCRPLAEQAAPAGRHPAGTGHAGGGAARMTRWLPPLRLRWLLMLVVLVAVLPGTVWILHSHRQASDAALLRAQSALQDIGSLTAASQTQLIEGVHQILVTLVSGPSVQREELAELCSEFLANIQASTPAYTSIGVLDLRGQSRCLGGPGNRAFNGADRAYFSAAMQAPRGAMVGGEYLLGRVSGRKALVFAMPVYEPGGSRRAVAYAGVDLARADERIKALGLPPALNVRFADGQGRLLVSAKGGPADIGQPLPEPALVQALQAGHSGPLELTDLQGKRLLGVVIPVRFGNQQPLYVTVSTPYEAALAPAHAELRRQIALLALAAAAGLALAWWLGLHWLARPVNQLLRRMDLAGRGERLADAASPPSRSVEIAELDAGFSRMLAAQHEQDQRMLHAQQIARIGFYTVDLQAGVLRGTPAAFALLGLQQYGQEIDLAAYQALVYPDDRWVVDDFRQRLQARTGMQRVRYRKFAPNGALRWIEAVADAPPAAGPAGTPITQYMGAVLDVTEQERARRLFAVQSRINEAIVRALTADALLDAACNIAVDEGLMRLAWVACVDGSARGSTVRAAAGPGLAYLDAMRQVRFELATSQTPVARALRDGEFSICNDVLELAALADWHAAARAHGIRSTAVIPLHNDTQVLGVLVLVSDAPSAFHADDARVLQAIGKNLSHALGALQADELRRAAERSVQAQLARTELLNRITRAIGDRLDLDAVFRVVADTLQAQLPAAFVAVALYETGSDAISLRCIAAASAAHAQAAGLAEGATVAIRPDGLSRCVAGELVHEPELDGLDFPLPRHLLAAGLHSAVLAPLQGESTVFGLVIVARAQGGAFSSGECEFLRQLGEQVALAASQARLHQTLQHTFAELQRSQQTALQQERLRALGQMASGIAHDINNAIAPVALYTESLLDGEPGLSDRARQYLQVIQRSIDDVSETVARMREFYRPQPPDARHGTLALNTLVQQVVELTRARWRDMAQQSGTVVQVRTVLADDLPLLQAADGEIREALTNLVLNAVDALPQGGNITLRTRQDGTGSAARLVVEVADDGVGMDDATRQRCLEPFFTTKGERGTGLGLAMVYGCMQRHGGQIEIDSAPGQGTTVRLLLPVARLAAVQPEAPTTAQQQLAPSSQRILVVDDDPLVLQSLSQILQIDAHQVTAAQGGQAGIDAFDAALRRGEPFALVITDLGMPGVDGHQVAAAVKSACPSSRVLMLTGWGRRMQQDGERPAHVDQLLGKPARLADIRLAIAAAVAVAAKD